MRTVEISEEQWQEYAGWFADKVCRCETSNIYHKGYDWDTMNEFKKPPYCADCNKPMHRLITCTKCGEVFYNFFRHPKMGYHSIPRRGWYCWNCLETYYPPTVEERWTGKTKIPPLAELVPPGYVVIIED